MKKITAIVAFGKSNRVIGNNGKLPAWKLSADMEHFKELTVGHIVIMGRKTWESLPKKFRPLPHRINIILTRNATYEIDIDTPETFSCGTLGEILDWADECHSDKNIFIIGGGEIYCEALSTDLVSTVIASEVEGDFDGDTFFPYKLDKKSWSPTIAKRIEADEKNSHSFTIVHYEKR